MLTKPLHCLAFEALATEDNFAKDEQNQIGEMLEIGEHAPLNCLVSFKEKYPERLGAIASELLSRQDYLQSCIDLTNIKSLYSAIQRLPAGERLPQSAPAETTPLRDVVLNNFNRFLDIDLVVMAMNQNHEFNDLAKTNLSARLGNGLLDGSIKAYTENNFGHYTDNNLVYFATTDGHPLSDLARQALTAKLRDNSFAGSMLDVIRLVPVLGEPARAYAEKNYYKFKDNTLIYLAKEDGHPLSDLAKQALTTKLQNDSFTSRMLTIDLINLLGEPAKAYVEKNCLNPKTPHELAWYPRPGTVPKDKAPLPSGSICDYYNSLKRDCQKLQNIGAPVFLRFREGLISAEQVKSMYELPRQPGLENLFVYSYEEFEKNIEPSDTKYDHSLIRRMSEESVEKLKSGGVVHKIMGQEMPVQGSMGGVVDLDKLVVLNNTSAVRKTIANRYTDSKKLKYLNDSAPGLLVRDFDVTPSYRFVENIINIHNSSFACHAAQSGPYSIAAENDLMVETRGKPNPFLDEVLNKLGTLYETKETDSEKTAEPKTVYGTYMREANMALDIYDPFESNPKYKYTIPWGKEFQEAFDIRHDRTWRQNDGKISYERTLNWRGNDHENRMLSFLKSLLS